MKLFFVCLFRKFDVVSMGKCFALQWPQINVVDFNLVLVSILATPYNANFLIGDRLLRRLR